MDCKYEVPTEPGIYKGVPLEEYLAWPYFSKSLVKAMARSPAHCRYRMLHPPPQTASMLLGSVADTLLFEPEKLLTRYAVKPETYMTADGEEKKWNGNATICKDWIATAHDKGQDVIGKETYEIAATIIKNARARPSVIPLLEKGEAQVSFVAQDEETGVLYKGRIDWLPDKEIVDFKTTKDASPDGFPWEISKYGYAIQGAMYRQAMMQLANLSADFILIAGENEPPYAVADYKLDDESLQIGFRIFRRAIWAYKAASESNQWPGYSQFREPIRLPKRDFYAEIGEETNDLEW